MQNTRGMRIDLYKGFDSRLFRAGQPLRQLISSKLFYTLLYNSQVRTSNDTIDSTFSSIKRGKVKEVIQPGPEFSRETLAQKLKDNCSDCEILLGNR